MWVLGEFNAMPKIGNSGFAHRHVGFKRCHGLGGLLLCTGMWVSSDFMAGSSVLVHTYEGLKQFYGIYYENTLVNALVMLL